MKITLKACRINVGASVKEFSKAVGVSEYTVYKWEKGETSPKITQVPLIIEFFNSKGFNIDVNDIKFYNKNSAKRSNKQKKEVIIWQEVKDLQQVPK